MKKRISQAGALFAVLTALSSFSWYVIAISRPDKPVIPVSVSKERLKGYLAKHLAEQTALINEEMERRSRP